MRRFLILALLAAPGLSACQGGVPVEEAVASINEDDYLRKISVIAHDSMMGRYNPSPGLYMTADWIAEEFERYGLKPGGDDGTFIQTYRIDERAVDFDASSATVSGGATLDFGTDLNFMGVSGGGEVSGSVALVVGDLASAQDLPAEEINGKHIILVPPEEDATAGRRRVRFPRGMTAAEPASVIFMDRSSDEEWAQAVERARGQTQRITPWSTDSGPGVPMLFIRESSLESLLTSQGIGVSQLAGGGGAAALIDLPSLEITLNTVTQELEGFDMPNTVGILEGSDPELKNEYIVFSGHMDHVPPTTPNEAGDSIRNGADDDGSGTIAVVELAEAFAMLAEPPKRSMVFLAVSGEEVGLWGSRVYAESPGIEAPGELVANLNADMISRNAPDSIVVIGKEHSDLGETMDRVNTEHPELNLTAADDIWPEQNFYRRSDHFNFARRGVPVLFFFCGTHEDYHGVDDEVEKMDITKATNTTKLMFYLGLEVGNAAERPQWDPASYEEIVDMGG
ncbi:MAG: M20/M25/M40 family metallo-hydrolase [Gemmatimonadota bacterium]